MPESLRVMSNDEDDREVRGTLYAMRETFEEVLLAQDDEKLRSMYLDIQGSKEICHALSVHGNLAGTGWKTTIVLSKEDQMISCEVKLPRGRHSYRTDILANLVTEEVIRAYAEHALVQLLNKNNREDALTQILERK